MSQEFIKEMEQALLQQKRELLERLAKEDEDFRSLLSEKTIKDSIDSATDEIAFKKMQMNATKEANRLQAIDNALARIHNNVYGRCLKCGKKIPEDRLRAIPYAVLCVECKSGEERPGLKKSRA
ncbi:MAG: TraR/DksA family transcriptional regulator [Spirochaetia bacterium]|jgi:RNA polymerase-binding protein DksA|nr:TraR/DksA family transcriptional regulator [Spirochaetia bacterium]